MCFDALYCFEEIVYIFEIVKERDFAYEAALICDRFSSAVEYSNFIGISEIDFVGEVIRGVHYHKVKRVDLVYTG